VTGGSPTTAVGTGPIYNASSCPTIDDYLTGGYNPAECPHTEGARKWIIGKTDTPPDDNMDCATMQPTPAPCEVTAALANYKDNYGVTNNGALPDARYNLVSD
jgi:hypothetical protein